MSGLRWVFAEHLAHVLTDGAAQDAMAFVAMCGLTVSATVPVYRVAPSLDVCRACERLTVLGVAPPEFPATPSVF